MRGRLQRALDRGPGGRRGPLLTLRRAPGRVPHLALLATPGGVHRVAIGRSGIHAVKREGDGATPAGTLRVAGGYVRPDHLREAGLAGRPERGRLIPLHPAQGWCDDSLSPAYNRPVRLPHRATHESMWRGDRLYDLVLALDWNLRPRARWRGSAIFLHFRRFAEDGAPLPTAGCIGIRPRQVPLLLPLLMAPGARIVVRA